VEKMVKKDLRTMHDLLIGGAVITKSTDVLAHARQPTALVGDVSGMVGVGVAGLTSRFVLDMALQPLNKRKRRRR